MTTHRRTTADTVLIVFAVIIGIIFVLVKGYEIYNNLKNLF